MFLFKYPNITFKIEDHAHLHLCILWSQKIEWSNTEMWAPLHQSFSGFIAWEIRMSAWSANALYRPQ